MVSHHFTSTFIGTPNYTTASKSSRPKSLSEDFIGGLACLKVQD